MIKPCPFCGYVAHLEVLGESERVVCSGCGAEGPRSSDRAVVRWNTRVEGSMDFFTQLEIFSERFFQAQGFALRESPWGSDRFQDGVPKGAIIHYTADGDLERVLRWFMVEKYQAKASSNVVIADRRYGSADALMEDLPLVQALPVTVVQCRSPLSPSWHATWTNSFCYGIELVNTGELRVGPQGGFVSWRPRDQSSKPWTMPWTHPLKAAQPMLSRFWEPYTPEQIDACVMVLRRLRELSPGLEPGWVLGHEAVQGKETPYTGKHDKRDPGPLLPVGMIRDVVFNEDRELQYTPEGVAAYYNGLVLDWIACETGQTAVSLAVAWQRFESAVRGMGEGAWGNAGKVALALLGYHVPEMRASDMFDSDRLAVRVFQRMMGLTPDQIPGPKTRAALVERLEDRGFFGHGV